MLAISLDNLLFFLLIAVAALFQLFSKAVSKASKSERDKTSTVPKPQTPQPIQRAPRESDADRIRKFLEALGQPPSSTPPPPVLPRTNIPPRPLAPVQPPPVIMPRTWRLPREQREKSDVSRRENAPLEQPSRLQQVVPPPVPPPAAPVFEIHEAFPTDVQEPPIITQTVETSATASQAPDQRADFKMHIATLLTSKSGLREAILLREILGTPRGLQALDLV